MSDGMNKVILLGNLGADPELRYTTVGIPVLQFRLATKETWVDKSREPQARTEWHTVVLFGNRAQPLAKILAKGSSVLVEGGLRTSSYEKDGQRRYRTEVHARDILLTGRRATAMGSDAPPEGPLGEGEPRGAPPEPRPARDMMDELPY